MTGEQLPDPPPPEKFTGPDGRAHLMEFRLRRVPTGIVPLWDPGISYAFCMV